MKSITSLSAKTWSQAPRPKQILNVSLPNKQVLHGTLEAVMDRYFIGYLEKISFQFHVITKNLLDTFVFNDTCKPTCSVSLSFAPITSYCYCFIWSDQDPKKVEIYFHFKLFCPPNVEFEGFPPKFTSTKFSLKHG